MHGLCFTATRLKYFGFRETDKCTLCNNDKVQNKIHYYFQCPSIECFWELVCVKFKSIINKELGKDSLTLKEKTLGIKPVKENNFAFLNLLIMCTQKIIYECHCFNEPLQIEKLTNMLIFNEKLERYNACKTDKGVMKHMMHFENFNNVMETRIVTY